MKMLVHRIAADHALAVGLNDAKLYLRLDHDEEDTAISNMLHTSTSEFEQFSQIAVLTQTIRVTIFDPPALWRGFNLPIGPLVVDNVPTVTIDGSEFTGFDVVGGLRPYLRWLASYPHSSPPDRIAIEYQAGFGATSADVPSDIAQAIMDQTGLHYGARSPVNTRELSTSPHMARIVGRYRGVKV